MQISKYDVSIDPVVNDRMLEHVRFLAKVSIPAAERLYESIKEAITELKDYPKSNPLYTMHDAQNFENIELRYKLCGKRYRIVYEISGNNVYVYDIQDCRQDSNYNLI